jgi:hypothetical protein
VHELAPEMSFEEAQTSAQRAHSGTRKKSQAFDVVTANQALNRQDNVIAHSIQLHDIVSGLFVNRSEFGFPM